MSPDRSGQAEHGFYGNTAVEASVLRRWAWFQVLSEGGGCLSPSLDSQHPLKRKLRPLWKSYTRRMDGLVFVVDAAETDRMEEAKVELHRIAGGEGAALHELSSSTLKQTQGCSALNGQGLQHGLEKLYEMILRRKKMLRQSKWEEMRGEGTSSQSVTLMQLLRMN
ncbi:hypothetical protein INR49_000988 [Caranx melampygus]|nr:hypothetical protein INR49_000988 [Caranx melampygus]